ncbi:sugar phosphate isomerase/epimerase family protein [Tetragenococcus muriaticus]|uniref:sugar phosphate isomerase/epimerase family protein n=1 Tax=Tetragenococcus muriaticus TaxID=64642 RepID=UPI000402F135|nr:sugar phosphate isomerase/epimerase family protein [Tetragenococcus muriaticus]GMA45984.1 AP endonuclease [Tetragenococcus muriaticus]GMA46068.1 AP endonuclease [Tetragenococcus muriaticus]GMA46227.1 AP endonuclease [Tetragenococcus muriaticus]GMA48533.1 AP endonuclease [Tetragenococcus muriaticus]
MSTEIPLTISSLTLGANCSFEERISAAANAGYEGVGLTAEAYADALATGLTDEDFLQLLEKYQIKVTEVECIQAWAAEERSYEEKFKEQICFHMCHLFGVEHVNVALMEVDPLTVIAEKLAQLCARAQDLIIAVEPMPYSGIPDFATAKELIQQSQASNVGILLDAWHWFRASQTFSELTAEDARYIVAIQLNDAYQRPYASAILRDEAMHDRLAPGDGAIDLATFITMVRKADVQPALIGIEVVNDELLNEGIETTANYTYEQTAKVLENQWIDII